MITYDPLWKTLAKKNIGEKELVEVYGFNVMWLRRIKGNQDVSIEALNELCKMLECRIEEIIKYIP